METKLSRIQKIEISLERIKQTIPDKYSDFVTALEAQNVNFKKTAKYFAKIAIKDPKSAHLLLSFRRLIECKNDPTYPLNPYYYDLGKQTQESINKFSEDIVKQWNEQRKNSYRSSKNVIYDREDFFSQYIFAPKYPVIAHSFLSHYLDQLENTIRNSDVSEKQFENLTFIQPVFSQDKNGNVVRFVKVLEIIPTSNIYGKPGCKSFDFSLSLKFMPDDNLNHSTCLFRFDSKNFGHKNVEMMENVWSYQMLYFNQEIRSSHLHFFDFVNTFTYLGMPLSSNTISLDSLAKFTPVDTPLPPHIVPLVKHMEEFKNVQNELNLSTSQLSKNSELNKKSLFTRFGALRKIIKLLDECYSIYPEKDISYVKDIINGDICKIVEQQNVEQPIFSKKQIFKKPTHNKPINPVRGNGRGNEMERKAKLIQKRNSNFAK